MNPSAWQFFRQELKLGVELADALDAVQDAFGLTAEELEEIKEKYDETQK